jgi:heptosyltransferase-3
MTEGGTKDGMKPVVLPENPRILVVSLRRIGDVLLTTPLIRSLRRAWPGATVDALVFSGTVGILKGNPDVNAILSMPTRPTFSETVALVRKLFKRYDLAVSTQTGDRPTIFSLLAGRTHAGLFAEDGPALGRVLKRAALHRSIPMVNHIHRVEQVLRLADVLGVPRVPEMVCPAGGPIESFKPGDRYAVIHAAPMYRYKQWTREGWRALATGLVERGLDVIAVRGPDEAERRYLEDIFDGIADVHGVAWPATVSLLKAAQVYIGPDTSVSHLAAAAGCPTVTVFGPMDPRAWGPWPVGGLAEPWQADGTIQNRGNVWVVQNPLPCMPCALEGCERHNDSASACLDELPADRVLAAVDQALLRGPARRGAAA